MSARRKALLPVLVLLVVLLFLIAPGLGEVELMIWLVLLLVWTAFFVRWGGGERQG